MKSGVKQGKLVFWREKKLQRKKNRKKGTKDKIRQKIKDKDKIRQKIKDKDKIVQTSEYKFLYKTQIHLF